MEIPLEGHCATSSISSATSWLIVSLLVYNPCIASTSFAKLFRSQRMDCPNEWQPSTPYPPILGCAPAPGACKTQSSFAPGNCSPRPQSSATDSAILQLNLTTRPDSYPQSSTSEMGDPSYSSTNMRDPLRFFLRSLLHVFSVVTVHIYRKWQQSTQTPVQ